MDTELIQDKISQGIALMSEENYQAAKECFETVIDINPRVMEAYEHLGNAETNLEQYDEAVKTFKKILLLDSNYGKAYFSIGSVYVLKDDKLKAVEYFNKAEEHGYQSSQMYQIMASIFFEADDESQALRNISRAINITPFDGELRIFKARIYLAFDRFGQAIETLDEMGKILPDAFEVYDLKAQILSAQGKFEEALSTINKGCGRFPDDANLAVSKLQLLISADKNSEAYQWIDEMKKNGLYEKTHKQSGIHEATLMIKDNNIEQAYGVLSQTNEKLGGDVDILYLLTDLCGKTSKYKELLQHSEALMKLECGDFYMATAMFFHATALDETEEKEKAQKEFRLLTSKLRKMTIDNPSFYEGYLYRLLSHTKIKEYQKALDLADYIQNLYPDRADAHAFRYFIYKEMGNEIEAENEKQIAKKLNSNLDIQ